MTGQFEESTNPEVQGIADEIGSTVAEAYNALLEGREAQLAAEIAPLDAEKEILTKEYIDIQTAAENLKALLPAQERQAQREADELLCAGRAELAQVKIAEAKQAAEAPSAMEKRRQEINARLEAIADERQAVARHVFSEWYVQLQTIIRSTEHALFVQLLDTSKAEMYRFQDRHDLGATLERPFGGLVTDGHLQNLTSDEQSPEWQAGHRFYGGREAGRR
jgi:uncharacterized protein YsxB (DUF464 family)